MDHNQEQPIQTKYNGHNGGKKIPTSDFSEAVFSTIEICGKILKIF